LAACLQSLTQLRLKEEKDGKEAVSTCNFAVQALLHLFNRWLSALLDKAAKCLSKPQTSFNKSQPHAAFTAALSKGGCGFFSCINAPLLA